MNNLGLENFKRKFEEQEMFEPELFLPRYYGENLEHGLEAVNWGNVAKVVGGVSIIGAIIALIAKFLGKGKSKKNDAKEALDGYTKAKEDAAKTAKESLIDIEKSLKSVIEEMKPTISEKRGRRILSVRNTY